MRRSIVPTALLALVLLAACGGQSADRGDVAARVKAYAIEQEDMGEAQADAFGDCVSDGMFDGETFTADERSEVNHALTGDTPDADLVARVETLVEQCRTESAATTETTEGSTGSTSGDGDSTTETTQG